ncbi:hypothetical protein AAE478_005602 [Parahypoxylon ruwenzoriense]
MSSHGPSSSSRPATTAAGQTPGAGAGASAAAGGADTFTAEMRDRQARGKDPYESSDGGCDRVGERNRYRAGGGKEESFTSIERRRVAAQVLDSPELLMMAAQRDNESIPATRLRYTRMLCGFEEPPAPPPTRRKSSHPTGSSSRTPSGAGGSHSSRKDGR